jgi:hypothetical protein
VSLGTTTVRGCITIDDVTYGIWSEDRQLPQCAAENI